MSSNYTWFAIMNLILHGSINVIALAVLSVGWKRTRRTGYLVLMVWVLVSLSSSILLMMGGAIYPVMNKFFPGVDQITLIMLSNMGTYLITSMLLLAGLGLLVFRDAPGLKNGRDAAAPT